MENTLRRGLNAVRAVRAAYVSNLACVTEGENVELRLAGEDGLYSATFGTTDAGSPNIAGESRLDLTMSGRPYTWDEDSDR